MNQDAIKALAAEALDKAVEHIQVSLGVRDCVYASMHFDGDVERDLLAMYVHAEVRRQQLPFA